MSGGTYLNFLISSIQERDKYVYLIKHKRVEGNWYFFDLNNDEPPYCALWVPYISPAFKFPSEQSVEDFKSDFLSSREVEVVRLLRANSNK